MAAETLAHFGANRDDTLTVMTNGGGAGVLAADAAALAGVPLRDLSEATRARLDAALPPTWSHGNPIDIIGDAPAERYVAVLQALLDDRDAGAVFPARADGDQVATRSRAPAPDRPPGRGARAACWLGDEAVAERARSRTPSPTTRRPSRR